MVKSLKILYYIGLWLPVFAWCSFIFFLSGIPDLKIEQLGILDLLLRKAAHVTEYFVLSLLLARALHGTRPADMPDAGIIFWGLFLSIVYAASDEYHQFFVPGRIASLRDMLIDSCGALAGSFVYWRHRTAGYVRRNE